MEEIHETEEVNNDNYYRYNKRISDMAFWEKIKFIFANITLEPVFFLFAMNFGFYAIAANQLYVDKMCQVNLNHSAEICDNINRNASYKEIQLTNQEKVTALQVISRVLQSIPPLIYALIAGPWSDRHGRKPLIVISIFGYVLANGAFLINTIWFHELKAEYLLLECLQGIINCY